MTTQTLKPTAPAAPPQAASQWTVIEPTKSWASLRLGEVWKARELIYFLMWRDIKVRYKQTAIGAGWAVLQPLITVLIFALLLGRYAHIKIAISSLSNLAAGHTWAYAIFIFSGLLPWMYFSYSVTQSGKSLVDNEKLITKIYFPRLALPIATTFTGIPDFFVGLGVFAAMMAIFGVAPTWRILFVPVFLLLAIVTAMGVGLWLSAVNVRFRDVRWALPFITQIWMFASPVVYSGQAVKGIAAIAYTLNPMAGVINGFRWALLDGPAPTAVYLLPSICVTAVLLVTGVFYFKHMDQSFADVI